MAEIVVVLIVVYSYKLGYHVGGIDRARGMQWYDFNLPISTNTLRYAAPDGKD